MNSQVFTVIMVTFVLDCNGSYCTDKVDHWPLSQAASKIKNASRHNI